MFKEDMVCHPFNIRCRRLAEKFLLKYLSYSNPIIFDTFFSLFLNQRKSLSILHLPPILLFSISLTTNLFFTLLLLPTLFSNKLKTLPPSTVNNLFLDYLKDSFPSYILIYTDGSVSPLSPGFSFFILKLCISYSSNLFSTSSSFSAEYYAILHALTLISSFPQIVT